MKNLFLVIIYFVTAICISQNIKIDSDKKFSTNEIDSLCKRNNNYLIVEGTINGTTKIKLKKNKTKTVKGTGGFSYKIYTNHFNEEKYNTLSKAEQLNYDFEEYSTLIKGVYHQAIHYENAYSENIYGEFYYSEMSLFYVKIKIIRTENNKKEISEVFNFNLLELEDSQKIKNISSLNLKNWAKQKNNEIIKFYNNK